MPPQHLAFAIAQPECAARAAGTVLPRGHRQRAPSPGYRGQWQPPPRSHRHPPGWRFLPPVPQPRLLPAPQHGLGPGSGSEPAGTTAAPLPTTAEGAQLLLVTTPWSGHCLDICTI